MNRILTTIILVIIGLLPMGCNIINPAEDIPTYVHIDSFTFTSTNPTLTGSNKQDITSVWAYVDGESIGVFDLPATIPVIITGNKELQLAPGVNNQGLRNYQLVHPLFSFYNINIAADPGKVINIQPVTKYIPDLQFWLQDFESGNSFSKLSGDTSIRRVLGQDSVFEGGAAGCISLTAAISTAESIAAFPVRPASQGYLEFHYKGTVPFQVGILAVLANGTQYSYLAGIKPKDEWGKFYLDIRQYTAQFPNALAMSVIIKSSLETGQTDGYVLLDNIKIAGY